MDEIDKLLELTPYKVLGSGLLDGIQELQDAAKKGDHSRIAASLDKEQELLDAMKLIAR